MLYGLWLWGKAARDRELDKLYRAWVKEFGTCPLCAHNKHIYGHGGNPPHEPHDCEKVIAYYSKEADDGSK